jgi:hypothetical protein
MDVVAQKEIIINLIKQVSDVNLINAIKSLLDYASKKENTDFVIPEAHRKLVMDRFTRVRANPDRLINLDEAKKRLNI